MPSVTQLRHEALAAAVKKARRSPLLRYFELTEEPLTVRVECLDGSAFEFRLEEVLLDGGEIVGHKLSGEAVRLPLTEVQAVWHHRLGTGRALGVWLATILASVAIGSVLLPEPAVGAGIGALVGVWGGFAAVGLLERRKVLYEWVPLLVNAAA